MVDPVRYRVSVAHPHAHLFEVEAVFPPAGETPVVCLPVWTPGSYLVREFARNVQDFEARDEGGHPVAATRLDKRSFRIAASGRGFRLKYRVYANELSVRTSHLDGTHGFFNGANLLFYVEGLRQRPHHLELNAPKGWTGFCALERDGAAWVAPDYDALVDSPVEVGPHRALEFSAADKPHQVVIWGDPAPDPVRLAGDLTRICEAEAALFGGLPCPRYLFIVHLSDKGRGGLEHMDSCTLLYPRFGLGTPKGWEDFMTLAAHEYFHLWNVKRIKPKALVPFDYSQEVYTSLLWAFEGVTSYYDNLLVRRAGIMSANRYLTRLGETLTSLQATPGRGVQTLADASWLSWIKHYRPDENSPNSAISYYLKGEVVACLLDLEIRRATRDGKSLDDVMRLLWQRFGHGRGVPEDGVEAAVAEVAGPSLRPFFDRALRSTSELDYRVFSQVGLEARFRVKESAGDKGGTPPRSKAAEAKPRGWLGVVGRGGSTLATVLDGSPAMTAGLYADDEVVALDGYRVDSGSLVSRCEDRRPGEQVTVTVFRRDSLIQVPVTLGAKPADAVFLARVEHPTEEQKAAYHRWLGAAWDEASAGGS